MNTGQRFAECYVARLTFVQSKLALKVSGGLDVTAEVKPILDAIGKVCDGSDVDVVFLAVSLFLERMMLVDR